jgi:hypothetical protein
MTEAEQKAWIAGRDAAAVKLSSMCPKCDGAGWLWGHELIVTQDVEGTDDTKYSCDSEVHEYADSIRALAPPPATDPAMPLLAAVIAHYGIDALCKALAPQIVREAEQPAPWTPPEDRAFGRECATEGCNRPSTVHFVRGGIGSDYCGPCYLRVQAAIAPLPGDAP